MNTGNWTKLYGNTIYSTIWQEPPPVRCVWITMLALADFEGYVGASVPGLAKAANVDLEVTEAALERFKSPDKYSRSKDHDGRRIEDAPGGWHILNFVTHRDGSEEQREKWRLAKRRQRQKDSPSKGAPLAGEAAYVKSLENDDASGASKILESLNTPPDNGKIPEIPVSGQGAPGALYTEPSGHSTSAGPDPEPAAESGRIVDGEWIPD